MKDFNYTLQQRKAALAIVVSVLFAVTSLIAIGKQNFWFEKKLQYSTAIFDADGLREGSQVTLQGLKVGEVEEIKLLDEKKIQVVFSVLKTMSPKVTEGTKAQIYRAYLVGEKSIDLIVGPSGNKILREKTFIPALESGEISDILSGKKLGPIVTKLNLLINSSEKFLNHMENLKPEDVALMKDTLVNFNNLAKNTASLSVLIEKDLMQNNLAKDVLTGSKSVLKVFKEQEKRISELIKTAHVLSKRVEKSPDMTNKLDTAVNELITTLRAMQKSWFLESHVEELKKQKSKIESQKK